MFKRMTVPRLAAMAVLLAAGTASAAQPRDETPHVLAAAASGVDFRSAHWLRSRAVVNSNDEEIATVSDLILDRGWGRIEHVIIKTGSAFGMGGRSVTIPYGSFKWEVGGKERIVLAMTAEQLKQFPEYTPESWTALRDATRDDKSMLRQRLSTDAASVGDPFTGALNTAEKVNITGEIKKVERVRTSTFGEQVQVTVLTDAGATRRIALGPSWFVNATPAAPMRSDKIVVETLALPRDPDQLLVATELRVGDRALHLRESDGTPAWALKSVKLGEHVYSTPYSRYLLLSTLTGMKVDCRGNECGKVQEVIIDRTSGEVAFFSIDPNQNFLGIGDTKRLIPWSIATVTLDEIVRIDASKEMVLASPETPSDLSTLNSGTHATRVYEAFNVPPPRFDAPKPISALTPADAAAWSARGVVAAGIEPNSARTMSGKVIDLTEVRLDKVAEPARAMKIRLAGDKGTEEVVLLGPKVYMEQQKPMCQAGDSITLEACRTTIDGHAYWIARSIDCKDGRVVLLDANAKPRWAQP